MITRWAGYIETGLPVIGVGGGILEIRRFCLSTHPFQSRCVLSLLLESPGVVAVSSLTFATYLSGQH